VKGISKKNYKPLKKEIKDYIQKVERSSMLRDWWSQYCKNDYIKKQSTCSIPIPISFITEIEKTTLNFLWNHKRQ
jgi:hypothetical protein